MKKVILYIAISADGFIARKNGSVDWLDKFNASGEDYGYEKFLKSINAVVMGNATYKQILSFDCDYPYKRQNGYVFANKKGKDENVTFVNGSIKKFVNSLKEGNIWLVGGANLVNQFIKKDLIDEFIIFQMPVMLGEGIRLFSDDNPEKELILKETKSYKSGAIEFHYLKKN